MKEKNYYRNLFIYLLIINSIYFTIFKIFKIFSQNNIFSPYSPKIERININDGNFAKIGIISDFQLDAMHTQLFSEYFEDNLFQALKILKKNNVDIIIIAGDITNTGRNQDYQLYNKIFNSVYNEKQKPIVISLMGNHDYLDSKNEIIQNQKQFFNYMKSYPYSHYIINNYNFIFWSNDNHYIDENAIEDYSWINSSLQKARNNKKRKGDPIFVVTHIHPKKTVYGSDGYWGHTGIFNILKNYYEVICISGHSHYSLRNIKSIWQKDFTAINTQSLSYVDLDTFYQNLKDVRFDSLKNDSMGLIAYLSKDNIIFERIEFSTEEIMEERWKINFPIITSNFLYTFEKRNKKIKPIFNDKNEIVIEKIKENTIFKNYIVFDAAFHEDYVYSYKIIFKKENYRKEVHYYSDYYKNKKLRKKILKFRLPDDINNGKYNVEIYAVDSFDNKSEPKIGIINF